MDEASGELKVGLAYAMFKTKQYARSRLLCQTVLKKHAEEPKLIEKVKPHSTQIQVGVVVLLVLVIGITFYSNQSAESSSEAWSHFAGRPFMIG